MWHLLLIASEKVLLFFHILYFKLYCFSFFIDLNQIFAATKAVQLENNRADTKPLSLAWGQWRLLNIFHLALFDWDDQSLGYRAVTSQAASPVTNKTLWWSLGYIVIFAEIYNDTVFFYDIFLIAKLHIFTVKKMEKIEKSIGINS